MPRRPRSHVPGGVYHVVLRGNHRQAIFATSADFLVFEGILAQALVRYGAQVHAYCWMTNHVHLAIQVDAAPLGNVMRVLASRYARYQQRAVPTTGHLFERRYRDRLIDADRYLLALLRYIHLNPVRAGMVSEATDYRWSSHRAYLGAPHAPWLTKSLALGLFGEDGPGARQRYERFMTGDTGCEELAAVRITAHHPDPTPTRPSPRGRPVGLEPTPIGRRPRSLELIIAEVATEFGVSASAIESRRRLPLLVQARTVIARRALREGVATLTVVAARLGRAVSTLSEALGRDAAQP